MAGADTPHAVASPGNGAAGSDAPRPRTTDEGHTARDAAMPQGRDAAITSANTRPAGRTCPNSGPGDAAPAGPPAEDAPGDAAPTGPAAEDAAGPAAQDAARTEPVDGPGEQIWTLVRLAQGGDTHAFGDIYDQYVDTVYRYVYHRIGDPSQAEDFTSETFLRALRRLDTVSYRGRDLGAWLITIARNIVYDHVKSSRYRLEVVTGELDDTARVQEGPEHAVLDRMDSQRLLSCVRQLGSEQQECIVLRFFQDMSVAETAQIMGKNDGAIKALQHRAVRRLAALLKDD